MPKTDTWQHPPRSPLSIHISVYLPTLGQESQFMEEMSKLSCTIDELRELHPNAPIFLRGDFNVNSKIKSRNNLLDYFTDEQNLSMLQTSHPTYHHFLGQGASDSFLDKIFFPRNLPILGHVFAALEGIVLWCADSLFPRFVCLSNYQFL